MIIMEIFKLFFCNQIIHFEYFSTEWIHIECLLTVLVKFN